MTLRTPTVLRLAVTLQGLSTCPGDLRAKLPVHQITDYLPMYLCTSTYLALSPSQWYVSNGTLVDCRRPSNTWWWGKLASKRRRAASEQRLLSN